MVRTFIAIDLPKEVKDYLFSLQAELRKSLKAKIRWTPKKNIHLTMKFLGETSEQQISQIKQNLDKIKSKKFTVSLNKIGFFPNKTNPKIIWIDLQPEEPVIRLQKLIDQETISSPHQQTRFKTHLTLGRIKFVKDKKTLKAIEQINMEKKQFIVSSFNLMQSTLTKDGSIYRTLKEYELS